MSKGNFGSGIIGFILGLLTFGLFTFIKRKRTEQIECTSDDVTGTALERVTKK